ncbi:MAG: site-specific DNA-methyltransferase [Chloroflexi bacterium]|nr:site-specific DNA-methyltransferase [Chloroflexota bacterium]
MQPSAEAPVKEAYRFAPDFDPEVNFSFFNGDCLELLSQLPDGAARLVMTSPPYNIGKPYEDGSSLDEYVEFQREVITESVRVLADDGSICWQVGNHVDRGEIIPLDALLFPVFRELGLKMRNRIVWHFEHGLHCTRRLSGRYETINWFTKEDDYVFDVDPIRIPQKYPNKRHFKGPRAGQLSGNPLGKNPGDVWVFPNVKNNHIEKTPHPCQFPVELVERLVLSMTDPGDLVLDPFMGVASTAVGALLHRRRVVGAEIEAAYYEIGQERAKSAYEGTLRTRPMTRSVYEPPPVENLLQLELASPEGRP